MTICNECKKYLALLSPCDGPECNACGRYNVTVRVTEEFRVVAVNRHGDARIILCSEIHAYPDRVEFVPHVINRPYQAPATTQVVPTSELQCFSVNPNNSRRGLLKGEDIDG